jgi:hypothetical protein
MAISPANSLISAQMALDEGRLDEAESYLAEFDTCQVVYQKLRQHYNLIRRELKEAQSAVNAH